MKYWNKQKSVRERCWTKVALQHNQKNNATVTAKNVKYNAFLQYQGWYQRSKFLSVKHSLQTTSGHGRFYMNINEHEIWFECAGDASWFIITNLEEF